MTSIEFRGFDSIVGDFKAFENVEQIIISEHHGAGFLAPKRLHGLEYFPRLKSIVFWGSYVKLDPSDPWLRRIKRFYAEKSRFEGLEDFSAMPHLQELYLAYSGFSQFPANLEALQCLTKLTMGGHRYGDIDLEEIDLSLMPCLQEAEFQTPYHTMRGIPTGMDAHHLRKVKVNHPHLSVEERQMLRESEKFRKSQDSVRSK